MGTEGHDPTGHDDGSETFDRLALPLLIPAAVFLFAVLAIYGLSRIYLELNDYHVGDVSMATPLAIGVALLILLICALLANQRRIYAFQLAGIFVVAASLLTAGSIWAAVHDENTAEVVGSETPAGTVTPGPAGGISVILSDDPFSVTADPDTTAAGDVTFNLTNEGSTIHNFRVIKTDLDSGSLPIDDSGFKVDEAQLDVVAKHPEFSPGEPQTLTATLEAGSYVLICNVASHYDLGMHAAFTVE